jgi:hypothetical protein
MSEQGWKCITSLVYGGNIGEIYVQSFDSFEQQGLLAFNSKIKIRDGSNLLFQFQEALNIVGAPQIRVLQYW